MERESLAVVEIKPTKPSKVPFIGPLIDRLRTRQELVARFSMPQERAQQVADSEATNYRKRGYNATGKTSPSANRTF